MKVTASLSAVALAAFALAGCTAPVESEKEPAPEKTSSTSEAVTTPTIEATQGPASWNWDVTGSGFTPGGQVALYVYGPNTFYETTLTATSNAVSCIRGICHVLYIGGGISTNLGITGCGGSVYISAYDETTGAWSNKLTIQPWC